MRFPVQAAQFLESAHLLIGCGFPRLVDKLRAIQLVGSDLVFKIIRFARMWVQLFDEFREMFVVL